MELFLNSNKSQVTSNKLEQSEIASLIYHDLFDYPLTFAELIKWRVAKPFEATNYKLLATRFKNGFYFLKGRDGLIYKRLLRKRISARKIEIAKKAGNVLKLIPTVKMVGVTGALSMENVSGESDIDLMVVTKKGSLWTTRLFSYMVLWLYGLRVRKYGDRNQKDKLCLNIWLDEDGLIWRKRDAYISHEIAQVLPLVNKNNTYEKFIWKNKWIKNYWPNSVRITKKLKDLKTKKFFSFFVFTFFSYLFEKVAFWFQYRHMRSRITREIVTPTRAFFHPVDWGKIVLGRLSPGKVRY